MDAIYKVKLNFLGVKLTLNKSSGLWRSSGVEGIFMVLNGEYIPMDTMVSSWETGQL